MTRPVPARRAIRVGTTALTAILATGALAACGSSSHTDSQAASTSTTTSTSTSSAMGFSAMPTGMGSSAMNSSGMNSSAMNTSGMGSSGLGSSGAMGGMDADGGAAPAGIRMASHPRYPVGSHVVLTADHEMGMKGAKATVVGAYATTTYAVDYTPTSGAAMVKDHKWVVQQEIRDAGTKPLADGTHVLLTASHMPGMQGANAVIVQSTRQTVYMVDWDMDGMTMKNHKWVVESEMRPVS